MFEKIASFLITLGLIAWNVFDMINGRASTFTYIATGVLSLFGIFELGGIISAKRHPEAANS